MSVGGTWGKLLHVDLTESKIWVEEPSDDVYLKLAGGRGLASYLLLRDMPAGADPLGRWATITALGSIAITCRSDGSYEPVPAPTLATVRASPSAAWIRARIVGSSRRVCEYPWPIMS